MRHVIPASHGKRDRQQSKRGSGLFVALSLVLVACSGGVTTTGYEPPPPTSVPLPTVTSPAPTEPPPSILPDTQSILLPLGPLEAGTYVSAYMAPSVAFTVPDGFTLKDEATDLLYMTSGPDQFPPDFAIFRVAEQGLVDMLAGLPALQVSRATDMTYPLGMGHSIDIQPAADHSIDVAIARTADQDLGFALPLGTRGRVFEFDIEDGALIVMFTAPGNQFDRYAPGAEAIAASIAIAGP